MIKALDINGNSVHIKDAIKGKVYRCPICEQEVIQRRGDIIRHHFAHLSAHGAHANYLPCSDTWQYDMTDWHMDWQDRFDKNDVEKVLDNGKQKHIADLLIGKYVVEFQHSNISIDDFRDRNEFYSSLGYKVIWVFDLTEEVVNEKMYAEGNKYEWALPKKLFRAINLEKEKATIYFQLVDDYVDMVSKAYDDFKCFYIDENKSFEIDVFVEMVKSNSEKILPKPKAPEAPSIIQGGLSLYDIWKPNYTTIIVNNLFNKNVMFINGNEEGMYKRQGRIIGKYGTLDYKTNRYVRGAEYYLIKDADKKIWSLRYAYVDKDYEKKQKARIDEIKYINSVHDYVPGGKQISEVIRNTYKEEIFVKNLFNNRIYLFQIISFPMSYNKNFNAFEYDEKTGEISSIHSNEEINRLKNKRIWKEIYIK